VAFSEDIVQSVWQKARVIADVDPTEWRKDECGAWIRRIHYEHSNSEFGWKIVNVSLGGPDELTKLRALHWQNRYDWALGQAHCKVTADSGGIANKGVD
jgi:hypothetical protein